MGGCHRHSHHFFSSFFSSPFFSSPFFSAATALAASSAFFSSGVLLSSSSCCAFAILFSTANQLTPFDSVPSPTLTQVVQSQHRPDHRAQIRD